MDIKGTLYSLQAQINDLIDAIEGDEPVELYTPVKKEEVPDPNGQRRFILAWAGAKDPGKKIYTYFFDTGPFGSPDKLFEFRQYPRGLAYDWDIIARGCKDASGLLYRGYNIPGEGKPCWNWKDIEANMPPDDVVEQRYKEYKGGLRQPVETWPEKYQTMWKKYH